MTPLQPKHLSLIVVLFLLGTLRLPAEQPAVRSIAQPLVPGETSLVTITLNPPAGSTAATITENIPSGWTAANASDGGVVSGETIEWSLAPDLERVLTYDVTVPGGAATETVQFSGTAEFTVSGTPEQSDTYGDRDIFTTPLASPEPASRSFLVPVIRRGGTSSGVTVTLNVPGGTTFGAMSEEVPPGWSVENITGGGTFNNTTNTINWVLVPPFPAELSYDLVAPAAETNPDDVVLGQFNVYGDGGYNTDTFIVGGTQRGFVAAARTVRTNLVGRIELFPTTEDEGHNQNANDGLDVGDSIVLTNDGD